MWLLLRVSHCGRPASRVDRGGFNGVTSDRDAPVRHRKMAHGLLAAYMVFMVGLAAFDLTNGHTATRPSPATTQPQNLATKAKPTP